MATNLKINEKLLEKAQELGSFKTKRETVDNALSEYIAAQSQKRILELAGKIEWDESYDYKKARQR